MGEHVFESLTPGTSYLGEVRATNADGASPWAGDTFQTLAEVVEPINPYALSRVELEHVLIRCVRVGTPEALADAALIRAELAGRTWQHDNPYA